MQNPLVVPLKILRGHQVVNDLGLQKFIHSHFFMHVLSFFKAVDLRISAFKWELAKEKKSRVTVRNVQTRRNRNPNAMNWDLWH